MGLATIGLTLRYRVPIVIAPLVHPRRGAADQQPARKCHTARRSAPSSSAPS
ncbi:hypothetical protein ACPA9J_07740 [Pseudomonas aeruginosa]